MMCAYFPKPKNSAQNSVPKVSPLKFVSFLATSLPSFLLSSLVHEIEPETFLLYGSQDRKSEDFNDFSKTFQY